MHNSHYDFRDDKRTLKTSTTPGNDKQNSKPENIATDRSRMYTFNCQPL